ncbi:ureidoglycolate lyase [Pollutimonas thiosulfatoxidans]|uniref:Ureidoglycolate hydrolase n=1 Tax=Pollutimonas thiosulfatoxidans TaxID=2028345 RepID=A0A410GFG5_9BURK|nr:ureidoglycolate lyase [Pollutimonas thiosulfatoxidans]QAA95043.1 hypothetical protein CKA81_15130 [Pollutimonas thiosulfatoxidans]
MATTPLPLLVEELSSEAFAPYGTVWGRPYGDDKPAFTAPATDFWHQDFFDCGDQGEPEVLWVNYRKNDRIVSSLEVHWLTEQAIVPLGSHGVIHIVALTDASGPRPDLATLKAFHIPPGKGISMHTGCWHATQVADGQVSCLMLTRGSTTAELVAYLEQGAPAIESAMHTLPQTYLLQI